MALSIGAASDTPMNSVLKPNLRLAEVNLDYDQQNYEH